MEQYLKNLPIRLHLRHLVSMIINLLRQQQHKYPFDSVRRNLSVVGRTRRCSVSSYDHRSSSWRHDRLPLIAITFRIYTIAVIIKHTRSYITRDYPPSPLDSSPRSPHWPFLVIDHFGGLALNHHHPIIRTDRWLSGKIDVMVGGVLTNDHA